jgi:hypothetical protein
MKVRELVEDLKGCNQDATIYFSQDEEGNGYCDSYEIDGLGMGSTLAIYPTGRYLTQDDILNDIESADRQKGSAK